GTVARVIHGRQPNKHTQNLALKLDKLPKSLRRMLAKALRRAPPAPPVSRPGRRRLLSVEGWVASVWHAECKAFAQNVWVSPSAALARGADRAKKPAFGARSARS